MRTKRGSKVKKLILSTAILASAGLAHADYQFEVGAALGQGDRESVDYDIFGIAGEMYFDKVDTSKGPLAEASFLSQSSGVYFSFSSIDFDVKHVDNWDTFGLGGRIVTEDELILLLGYSETDTGNFNHDTDNLRLGVGTYINPYTDIVVSVEQESGDHSADDVDSLNVDLHGVAPLQRGESVGYDLTASYIDTDDDNGYNIGAGATYYPTRVLGLGLSADITEAGDLDTNTITADISYFPAPNIQLSASWFDQGGDLDRDGILLGVSARF
jgi:hypothetical protein